MLFKEILELPSKGSSNPKLVKCKHPTKKMIRKPTERKNNIGYRAKQGNVSRKSSASNQVMPRASKGVTTNKRNGNLHTTTKYDSNLPSSTPNFTPIKKDKLPSSITSSQCSLIELLQQYNLTSNPKQSHKDNSDLDQTLVSECAASTPNKSFIDPQMQTFKEVLEKLLRVVNSSKGNDNDTMQSAFNDVQVAFKSLPIQEKTLMQNSCTSASEKSTKLSGNKSLEELQIENLSLHRKLRLAKKEVELHETKSQSQPADISLEVMTIQCQNKALEQKVLQLTSSLEQALCVQQSIMETNSKLTHDNERLQHELLQKRDELTKSGDLFSVETKEIKKDVGEALQKVECLKLSVEETNKENEELLKEIEVKNKEISRLTDLNRGLQGSVSRLLEDLKNASKPNENTNIKSAVLKKLDHILSSPSNPDCKSGFVKKTAYDSSSKSPAVLISAPRTPPVTQNYFPPFNSCRSSPNSPPTVLKNDVTSSCSIKSIVGSTITPSLPTTDSVSSSMWSVTSHDERDFNAGLASLDADIRRLQSSLSKFNV